MAKTEVEEKYMGLIQTVMLGIRSELDRLYWNKNQKQMSSPFDNTGAEIYENDAFRASSYDWNGNYKPNFKYKNFSLWWYKRAGRGMYAETDGREIDAEFIRQMHDDCMEVMRKDFGEQ